MIAWNIHMKPVLAWKVFHYGETSSFLVPPDLWPGGMYPTPGTLKNLYRASKDQWFYLKDLVPQSCSSVKVKTAKTSKMPWDICSLPTSLMGRWYVFPTFGCGNPHQSTKKNIYSAALKWRSDSSFFCFHVSTFFIRMEPWGLKVPKNSIYP